MIKALVLKLNYFYNYLFIIKLYVKNLKFTYNLLNINSLLFFNIM